MYSSGIVSTVSIVPPAETLNVSGKRYCSPTWATSPGKKPRTRPAYDYDSNTLATPPSSPPVYDTFEDVCEPEPLFTPRRSKRLQEASRSKEISWLRPAPVFSNEKKFSKQEALYIASFNINPNIPSRGKVFRSPLGGYGVMAERNYRKGTVIGEYTGERLSGTESDKRQSFYASQSMTQCYLWTVADGSVIDATNVGNKTRFVNHSCAPNCTSVETEGTIFFYTNTLIQKGTELTIDYSFLQESDDQKIPCNCGTKKCRRFLN